MLIYGLKNLHSKRQFCFRNTMLKCVQAIISKENILKESDRKNP